MSHSSFWRARWRMTKVKCLKCGNEGYLITKQTVSKGIKYQYWYVKHNIGDKIKWCYVGKTLPVEYNELIPKIENTQSSTQNSTQNIEEPNNLKSSSVEENMGGRSLAWLGHRLPKPTTRVQIPVTAPRINVFLRLCHRIIYALVFLLQETWYVHSWIAIFVPT